MSVNEFLSYLHSIELAPEKHGRADVTAKDRFEAFRQLLRLLDDVVEKTSTVGQFIKKQLVDWFVALPCYIRVLLPKVP